MSNWYRVGTASFSNGSKTVNGVGTLWTALANSPQVSNLLRAPDGKVYEVDVVVSSTEITLGDPYDGPTVSGASYGIVPTMGLASGLAKQVADLIASAGGTLELAESIAALSGDVYPNEPTGRGAVADGAVFRVQGTGDVAMYLYRRIDAGTVATLLATFPSLSSYTTFIVQFGLLQGVVASYDASIIQTNTNLIQTQAVLVEMQNQLDEQELSMVELSTNLVLTQTILAEHIAFA